MYSCKILSGQVKVFLCFRRHRISYPVHQDEPKSLARSKKFSWVRSKHVFNLFQTWFQGCEGCQGCQGCQGTWFSSHERIVSAADLHLSCPIHRSSLMVFVQVWNSVKQDICDICDICEKESQVLCSGLIMFHTFPGGLELSSLPTLWSFAKKQFQELKETQAFTSHASLFLKQSCYYLLLSFYPDILQPAVFLSGWALLTRSLDRFQNLCFKMFDSGGKTCRQGRVAKVCNFRTGITCIWQK